MKRREMVQVGVGMIPRGEVGIVVAQIGLGMAVISREFFAAVLFMAVATTLIAPPLIKWSFSDDKGSGKSEEQNPDMEANSDFARIG
jgi:Kef-type K+ transport system membrane component KefB